MIQAFFGTSVVSYEDGVEVPAKLARQWETGLNNCKAAGVHPVSRRGLLIRWQVLQPNAAELPLELERVAERRKDTVKEIDEWISDKEVDSEREQDGQKSWIIPFHCD